MSEKDEWAERPASHSEAVHQNCPCCQGEGTWRGIDSDIDNDGSVVTVSAYDCPECAIQYAYVRAQSPVGVGHSVMWRKKGDET